MTPEEFEDRAAERRRKRFEESQRRRERMRQSAIDRYGQVCRVCGEPDRQRLQIVPAKGYRWTHELAGKKLRGSYQKLLWLKKHGFPDGFALVCGTECRRKLQDLP